MMQNNNQSVEQYIASLNGNVSLETTQYIDPIIEKTDNYLKTTEELFDDADKIEYESKKVIKCKRYKLYKTRKS